MQPDRVSELEEEHEAVEGELSATLDPRHRVRLERQLRRIESEMERAGRGAPSGAAPLQAPQLPDDFVQRPEALDALIAALTDDAPRAAPLTIALWGAPGFGKTTLADAACHDPRVRAAFPGGILRTALGQSPGDLAGRVADWIEALTGQRPGYTTAAAAAAALADALRDLACLLVIDDVWDRDDLEPFLHAGPRCAYLLTTRDRGKLPGGARILPVEAMRPHEAVALIAAGLPPGEKPALSRLAGRLGEWPLLLKLVNGALREQTDAGLPLATAIDDVTERLDEAGPAEFDASSPASRNGAVAATLGLSLHLLAADELQRFYELAAFPEDLDIPLTAIEQLWGARGSLKPSGVRALCGKLARLSLLLAYDAAAATIRLHDAIRDYLLHDRSAELPAAHAALLDAYLPPPADWPALPPGETYLWRNLAAHLRGAGRGDELRALLLDARYLSAKLAAAGAGPLLADFDAVGAPLDPPLRAIRRALELAAPDIDAGRATLAGELIGRLLDDPSPEVRALLARAATAAERPWLRPLTRSLTPPGDPLLRVLDGHDDVVRALAVTPDGRHVVSAGNDGLVLVWDLAAYGPPRRLEGHGAAVAAVEVTPDGRRIVSAGIDGRLIVWDFAGGAAERTIELPIGPAALALAPDGRLAYAAVPGGVWIVDLTDGSIAPGPPGREPIAVTPEGAPITLLDGSPTLHLPDGTRRPFELRQLEPGGLDLAVGLAVTPDGRELLAVTNGDVPVVLDIATGRELRRLAAGGGAPTPGFTADGQRTILARGGDLVTVALQWNLVGAAPAQGRYRDAHDSQITALRTTPDGRALISAGADEVVKVWDLSLLGGDVLQGPSGADLLAVTASPRGCFAFVRSIDFYVIVLDARRPGEYGLPLHGAHQGHVMALVATPDGASALTASEDGSLVLWRLEDGAALRTLRGHTAGVNGVAITPDGRRAVSCGGDGTLRVWDVERGTEDGAALPLPAEHTGWTNPLCVTVDGRYAVFTANEIHPVVFDLERRALLGPLEGHRGACFSVAALGDGPRALTGSRDGTVRMWDLSTRETLAELWCGSRVFGLAATRDSRRAVATTWDRDILVWDLERSALLARFAGESPIVVCAIAADGRTIVAGERSGRVHVLELEG